MNGVTDRVDINQLLTQMRDIRGQMQTPNIQAPDLSNAVSEGRGVDGAQSSDRVGFADMLKNAVDSVNETQMQSSSLQRAFEMGDPEVDITQVMIQMQKASVSFEAMTQVRNRLVSAYQDIMNMPI
ncbi:flagellar hook-basal body complex protein FliE [Pseudohongiella sp.]|uniref:Flagellar hook-basal body complex protein FliE n=1 Tax=marine sediment metagenome TaxID=412755 RepID=A0A0F9W2Z1_9ZZZZ|nr:flagellar hook-basal body complex protein FliE [Pseudohongiella sp.]HDZ09950.1 flagellar hook-basal body complex protein FliE [Pseudohongiella sp.]HEA63728.1 flagellar hook-basal body complex protein FliE [Pseudohongiella sp.]